MNVIRSVALPGGTFVAFFSVTPPQAKCCLFRNEKITAQKQNSTNISKFKKKKKMPTEGQTVAAPSSNGSNDDLTHNVAAPAELDRAAVTIVTLYFQCHDHAKSISISTKCSKFCYQYGDADVPTNNVSLWHEQPAPHGSIIGTPTITSTTTIHITNIQPYSLFGLNDAAPVTTSTIDANTECYQHCIAILIIYAKSSTFTILTKIACAM